MQVQILVQVHVQGQVQGKHKWRYKFNPCIGLSANRCGWEDGRSYYPVVGTTSRKGATSFEASSW